MRGIRTLSNDDTHFSAFTVSHSKPNLQVLHVHRRAATSPPCSYSCPVESLLLPGEGSVLWKSIATDIRQFDKVDLVSKVQFQAALPGRQIQSS